MDKSNMGKWLTCDDCIIASGSSPLKEEKQKRVADATRFYLFSQTISNLYESRPISSKTNSPFSFEVAALKVIEPPYPSMQLKPVKISLPFHSAPFGTHEQGIIGSLGITKSSNGLSDII